MRHRSYCGLAVYEANDSPGNHKYESIEMDAKSNRLSLPASSSGLCFEYLNYPARVTFLLALCPGVAQPLGGLKYLLLLASQGRQQINAHPTFIVHIPQSITYLAMPLGSCPNLSSTWEVSEKVGGGVYFLLW